MNDESSGTWGRDNHVRFEILMLNSSLCKYSDAITDANTAAANNANSSKNTNQKTIFKNCATFTSCISRINNI